MKDIFVNPELAAAWDCVLLPDVENLVVPGLPIRNILKQVVGHDDVLNVHYRIPNLVSNVNTDNPRHSSCIYLQDQSSIILFWLTSDDFTPEEERSFRERVKSEFIENRVLPRTIWSPAGHLRTRCHTSRQTIRSSFEWISYFTESSVAKCADYSAKFYRIIVNNIVWVKKITEDFLSLTWYISNARRKSEFWRGSLALSTTHRGQNLLKK